MLVACGLFIAFQACAGFLFGQFFAGHFSVPGTMAGCGGLACAVAAFRLAGAAAAPLPWAPWASALTLAGVALDIGDYYLHLDIPGNYYPWFLVVPFAVCVAWVGQAARYRAREGGE